MAKNYMLALDIGEGSGSNEETIQTAEKLAENDGAQLHVMTVIPSYSMPIVGSYFPEGFEEKNLKVAERELRKELDDHALNSSRIESHVIQGSIYGEIMATADRLHCELIIMEAHRPELKDFLLGPNAARVVRHAKQSVYVVRHAE